MHRIIVNQINFSGGVILIGATKYITLFLGCTGADQLRDVRDHFLILVKLEGGYFSQEKAHIKEYDRREDGHCVLNIGYPEENHAQK